MLDQLTQTTLLLHTQLKKYSQLKKNFQIMVLKSMKKIKQNKTVVKAMGEIPQIEIEEDKRNWLNILDQSGNNLKDQMEPYVKSEGPIISYGLNYQGYLTVNILEETEIDDSLINEVYDIFDQEGKKTRYSRNSSCIPILTTI